MTEVGVAASWTSDAVALLERAMGYTLGSLAMVTPAALTRATPCAGWDLRALLAHMNESLHTLHDATAVGHLDPPEEVRPGADFGDPGADPVGVLRSRGCAMLGAWLTPHADLVTVGERGLPAAVVAAAGALEVTVHGWDVAAACGRPRPLPDALAAPLLDVARLLVDDVGDRPVRFGPPVPVGRSASAGDRLLAFLGRAP